MGFDAKHHEKGMWQRYYSDVFKQSQKRRYKCDICGKCYEWDTLLTRTVMRGSMTATKRTCKKCVGILDKITK